jgi:hypothetical protein
MENFGPEISGKRQFWGWFPIEIPQNSHRDPIFYEPPWHCRCSVYEPSCQPWSPPDVSRSVHLCAICMPVYRHRYLYSYIHVSSRYIHYSDTCWWMNTEIQCKPVDPSPQNVCLCHFSSAMVNPVLSFPSASGWIGMASQIVIHIMVI